MSNPPKINTQTKEVSKPVKKNVQKPTKLFSKEDRHALAHLESLQGRTSPEFQKSPVKRPVASPNHQMKSNFDFNGNSMSNGNSDMATVYMKDYCGANVDKK